VLKGLESRDIFCRKIKVDVASHSPQMDPSRPELVEALRELVPKPSVIPIYSTVTGAVREGQSFDANYWGENLRKPVLFSAAVTRLLEDKHSVFIEMSPHPVLLRAIDETCEHRNKAVGSSYISLPSLLREEDDLSTMLASAGRVYTSGYPIRWQSLYPQQNSLIKLPSYPWQRKRYWLDETNRQKRSYSQFKRTTGIGQIENIDALPGKTQEESEKSNEIKASRTLQEALNAAEPGKPRVLILETHLKEHLAKILMLPQTRLDSGKAFKAYGMDSLTALKFRGRIESTTGLRLSATLVWNYPTIKQLAAFLAEKMGMPLERPENGGKSREREALIEQKPIGTDTEALGRLLEELESMSDEEARKLLDNEH
jgi:acyl transferase domain-containing protein